MLIAFASTFYFATLYLHLLSLWKIQATKEREREREQHLGSVVSDQDSYFILLSYHNSDYYINPLQNTFTTILLLLLEIIAQTTAILIRFL